MKKYFSIFVLIAVFLPFASVAQSSDFKVWSAVELNHKINKQWSFSMGQHFRLKKEANIVNPDDRILDSYITQSEVTFEPAKRWDISLQLRYYRKVDDEGKRQGYDDLFRYRIGIRRMFKVPHGNLGLRLAFQDRKSLNRQRFTDVDDWLDYGKRTKKIIRLKPSFEWKIKNWSYDPVFYSEYLRELGTPTAGNQSIRFGVGTKIKVVKNQSLSFRYFYETTNCTSCNAHVINLRYTFKTK
ncbi:MAG: DUF2490 domain-containing protein [Chitinophagales bacterium]